MQIDSDNSRGGRGPVWRGGGRSSGRSGGRSGGATANVPCRFFLEGKCERGDACNFLHNIDPGAVANGRKRISERGPAAHDPRPGASFGGGRNGPGPSGSAFDRLGGQSPFDRLGGGAPQTPAAGSGYGAYGGGGMQNGGQGGRGQQARFGRRGGGAGRSGPQQQKRGVCRYWLGGSCRNGANCNFLHVHATAPDVDLMTELKGHEKAVRAIALPAGSSELYTGSQDQSIRVWDCGTGQCKSVVPMGGDVGALLTEAGFLFVGLPNEIKVWNMQSAPPAQHSLPGHVGQVHSLAVGNNMLFSGAQDGTIRCWVLNTASQNFEHVGTLSGHTAPVVTLQCASNKLYSGSMDKTIRVWDLTANGACIQTLSAHENVVMSLLCWDQYLISCSLDNTIRVWGLNPAGQLENTYTYPEVEAGAVRAAQTPQDGALALCGTLDEAGKPILVCAYNDNSVRLYDLPTFQERGILYSSREVRTLLAGPSGLLFTGDSAGLVKVWTWKKAAPS